ncbi:hypothetical protein BKA65DRAFT_221861 [Rhexocercosporidium sp. MPI-PUGE-AT-0058]|nr:hypothetical protein BKA65DRAFT_221861 [Rhexocercosporidium sp. MPI-PUGE-AT-0058]
MIQDFVKGSEDSPKDLAAGQGRIPNWQRWSGPGDSDSSAWWANPKVIYLSAEEFKVRFQYNFRRKHNDSPWPLIGLLDFFHPGRTSLFHVPDHTILLSLCIICDFCIHDSTLPQFIIACLQRARICLDDISSSPSLVAISLIPPKHHDSSAIAMKANYVKVFPTLDSRFFYFECEYDVASQLCNIERALGLEGGRYYTLLLWRR